MTLELITQGCFEQLVAKQDAFDEANRLKNQFRALDQDEVEFLDSVLESTRAEEARLKKETADGLALFRQQQDDADRKARTGGEGATDVLDGPPVAEEESWVAAGRKRKRTKDKEVLKGVKIRRSSTSGSPAGRPLNQSHERVHLAGPQPLETTAAIMTNSSPKVAREDIAGAITVPEEGKKPPMVVKVPTLVSYGSDEDDD
jgi:hypothetical protein